MFLNDTNISSIQPTNQPLRCFKDNSTGLVSVYSISAIKASLIILGLEMILGFFANVALFATLRNHYNRNTTVYRVLVQNLCLIGALNSLIGMPSLFAVMHLSTIEWASVPAALCRTRYFSLTYFFITDSINICLLSLDRKDYISRPFRRRITKGNVKRYIAAIWVIPFVIGLLNIVVKINSKSCILVSSSRGSYSEPMTVLLSVILVFTCSFVVITNWSSLKSMRNLARRLNTSRQNHARSERKMIILTMKIVAIYLGSVVPATLWSFGLRVGGIKNCVFCNDVRIYLQLLLFVRYIVNPFIFMGSTWKKKRSRRRIGVLGNPRSRNLTHKEVGRPKGQPLLVIPTDFPGETSSFGGIHQMSRSQRVVTIQEEHKAKHIEFNGGQVAYVNQETQTRDLEPQNNCQKRRQKSYKSNSLPIILVHS